MISDLPALSICVPTYNRCQKLQQCLESIAASLNGWTDSVEILVSDNCSTDGTAEIVEAFTRTGSALRYHKQEKNIGAEANFWWLWEAARGSHVWLIGDDDRIEPEAVGVVLAEIKKKRDIVILGYSSWNHTFELCQNSNVFGAANGEFKSKEELIGRFGPALSFISVGVIRKTLIQKVSKDVYMRLASTGFSFMYAIYIAASWASDSALLGRPLVKNRNVTVTSYNWDDFFITGIAVVFDELAGEGYSRKGVASAKNMVIKNYIAPKFKERRLAGQSLRRQVQPLLTHYGRSWRLWVLVLPIVVLPNALLRIMFSAYNLTRGGRTLVGK